MRGLVGAMVLFAAAGTYGAISGPNYEAAKGSVYMIDRKCNFVETTKAADGTTTARGLSDSCNSTDEWQTVREKRTKIVSGKAVVHVNFTAPQDGSARTGKLEFDGRDDEFYELKAGDEIDILVSNDDPGKITKS